MIGEASTIKHSLKEYGDASCQKISYQKSTISFSRNVLMSTSKAICSLLSVRHTIDHGHYLGLPSFMGRGRRKALEYVNDRVWHRLYLWGMKHLSRAGKEVVLKILAPAFPNYTMYVFLLPLGVCRDIKVLFNRFWWGCNLNGGKSIKWM